MLSSAAPLSALPIAVSSSTLTSPPVPPHVIAPVSPTQDTEENLAVGNQNVPGMDLVDNLADYLVELKGQTGLTLSSQQVNDIVALWENLLDFDKQRVVFAATPQERLTTGRFRSPKKVVFTPGVDSLK
ncbi:hypothetical protein QTP70_017694, partial [Hemibagrus guttatus]